ncbi:monooxygenase [Pseudoclavibacter endophyticus]|nr:NtaA/DmoA family FMN-dependent monooxygenase [Pseudoclavibacter endophyticus]GGA58084.1 monooxygenase [Pseudoclavibacter endophyticus]
MSPSRPRQLTLTMFTIGFGYHNDAWRHPSSVAEQVGSLKVVAEMAQAAERAKLDAVFFADNVASGAIRKNAVRGASFYEPIATMGALIGSTEKIGMIGTMSTTWSEPFQVARQFAALDQLSGGRIGWNVVTSINGNENFGREQMPLPEQRYERAMEFVDVVLQLWDSWDRDAIICDRETARWVDPDRVREIDHVGEHFRVKGPLSIPRSPQERPVVVQAGQSAAGIELGSSYADLIYTVQPELDAAIAFRTDYRQRVAAKGRNPDGVRILPGIMPITGRTKAEAQEFADELANCIYEPGGREVVERLLDVSVADLELTERIPLERLIDGPQRMERWKLFRDLSQEMTLGELMVHVSRAVGHRVMVDTPDRIADSMIEWFEAGACDGFNFNPPSVPEGMHRMFDLLVPVLQERGYFREDYEGDTFRERSGLVLDEPSTVAEPVG